MRTPQKHHGESLFLRSLQSSGVHKLPKKRSTTVAVYDIGQKEMPLGPKVIHAFSSGTETILFWWPDRALVLYEKKARTIWQTSLEQGSPTLCAQVGKVGSGARFKKRRRGEEKRAGEHTGKQRQRKRRVEEREGGLGSHACLSWSVFHTPSPSPTSHIHAAIH